MAEMLWAIRNELEMPLSFIFLLNFICHLFFLPGHLHHLPIYDDACLSWCLVCPAASGLVQLTSLSLVGHRHGKRRSSIDQPLQPPPSARLFKMEVSFKIIIWSIITSEVKAAVLRFSNLTFRKIGRCAFFLWIWKYMWSRQKMIKTEIQISATGTN